MLRRRNWCNSKFYSLVKVRKRNPQKAILQNPKFTFLLNMRESFTNGELNFYSKYVQILSYHDSDAKTALYNCISLTNEISWLQRLFRAFMSWKGIPEKSICTPLTYGLTRKYKPESTVVHITFVNECTLWELVLVDVRSWFHLWHFFQIYLQFCTFCGVFFMIKLRWEKIYTIIQSFPSEEIKNQIKSWIIFLDYCSSYYLGKRMYPVGVDFSGCTWMRTLTDRVP